ncbi:MAG: hypothetical protein AB9866_09850 [Syntrophobacteraceae bacterium]
MPESRKSGKVIHLTDMDTDGRGTAMRRPGSRQADALRFLTPWEAEKALEEGWNRIEAGIRRKG